MHIEQFVLEGLGHQSYCVSDGDVAVIVDPRRDVEVYLAAAAHVGARITHVLETHLHNDYVTGARELAARTQARIVTSADAHLHYEHIPVREGDRVQTGDLVFGVLATPGHTSEHVSYVLYAPDGSTPKAIFSGGSMLVGGAGRTDLMGPDRTDDLTRRQYHTLLKLLKTLPDAVQIYPTHGAGSFCVAGSADSADSARHTTVGQERLVSPAVHARDVEDFVRRQMARFGAYPAYYAHMRQINMDGPVLLAELLPPRALEPTEVWSHLRAGVPLVDSRPRDAFARVHAPGSLNVELDPRFGTYVGWMLPFNASMMLVVEDPAAHAEATVQLQRIGFEAILGYLEDDLTRWASASLPVERFETITVPRLYELWRGAGELSILDVRREEEWREGHIPGARHIHVADLPTHLGELPDDRPVAVICASGYRAELAASVLAAQGRQVIAVRGGVPEWLERGWPAERDDAPAATIDGARHAHP